MSQRLANGVGRKQNVGIGADEAFVHLILSMKKRSEDVVVFPIRIVTKSELRISLANLVDLVAADKNNVIETVGTECGQRPIKDAAALDLRETLGRVSRGGHQANATPGANDYCFHKNTRSKRYRTSINVEERDFFKAPITPYKKG